MKYFVIAVALAGMLTIPAEGAKIRKRSFSRSVAVQKTKKTVRQPGCQMVNGRLVCPRAR